MKSSKLYASLPLQPHSKAIRLLDLDGLPYWTRDNDIPITGRLRVASLSSSPVFTALSYVWGTASASNFTISCDSCEIQLTKNCFDALRCIRKRYGSVTIWVDSICINQSDNIERSHQLELMGDIFTWARTVYVWLGHGTPRTDAAILGLTSISVGVTGLEDASWLGTPNMAVLSEPNEFIYVARVIWFILRRFISHVSFRKRKAFQRISEKYRSEDLEELLSLGWFSRGWTFQEIVLACNPVILCGDKVLPWETFLCGMWGLKQFHDDFRGDFTLRLEFPDSFYAAYALCNNWVHTPRLKHWNGKKIRKDIEKDSSFRSYQLRYWDTLTKIVNWKMGVVIAVLLLGNVQVLILYYLRDHGIISELTATWMEKILSFEAYVMFLALCVPNPDRQRENSDLPVPDWWSLTDFPYWLPLHLSLPGIIHAVRSRIVTDPKDKSYSIYGVLTNLGIPLARADYAKSQQKIYQELFLDLLEWNALSITLILDAGESGLPNAPSWVPNWHNIANRAWLDSRYFLYAGLQSATQKSTPHITTNGNEMTLSGVWIDRAVFCTEKFEKLNIRCSIEGTNSNGLLPSILALIRWLEAAGKRGKGIRKETTIPWTVSGALKAQRPKSKYPPRAAAEDDLWYQIMCQALPTIGAREETSAGSNKEARANEVIQILDKFRNEPRALKYHVDCCNMLSGKRILFVTAKGLVGTGPQSMVCGDKITLIAGLPVPLVLRKKDNLLDRFTLVGPAYMTDIMDANLWDSNQALQEIILV